MSAVSDDGTKYNEPRVRTTGSFPLIGIRGEIGESTPRWLMAACLVSVRPRKVKAEIYAQSVNLRRAHVETESQLARKPRKVGVRLKDNARTLAVCEQCVRGPELLRNRTHRRPPARRQAKGT